MTTALKVFDRWKEFLGDRVEQAEKSGMSEETMSKLAFEIGEFLANKVDPKNNEERVLKDLWDAGDEQEKKVMARLMIKLAKNS
ncbi:DUF3243 domain-containing protein [Paenibacillus filicis]|uniref:DUF3243 domain-containing protein n=1 Tax=Paenibacillus gyeongsangnamensis TaxID=3388067 RepID=A0ABT4Q689_9BACL|nr:DUF3243 domain-containing protein [Paenibacillus filicis]MCZ8512302.1 DUF3243 domain-containing protein [Paenibacillus filicis]